jgi:NifU-like protein involved in Fe-S cluster formation
MRKLSDKVIEHFQNPQNVGVIDFPEGIGTISNPVVLKERRP